MKDQFVVVGTTATLCEGYSDPTFATFDDYGFAYEYLSKKMLPFLNDGYSINNNDIKYDGKNRRTLWNLSNKDDDGYLFIIYQVEPIMKDDGSYVMPKYLAYDQIYSGVEWLWDYVELRCHVSNIALHSRGFDQDFMRFNELTHELYEHVFYELDDMDENILKYVTLDDDDVCIHYHKIQYNYG